MIVNESEASGITGLDVTDTQGAELAGKTLLDYAVSVIVTLGQRGAVLVENSSTTLIEPFPVKGIDATGAGDAFVGGFARGIAFGQSPVDSARIGCAAGAAAVTRVGARSSLPTSAELFELFGLRLDPEDMRVGPPPGH